PRHRQRSRQVQGRVQHRHPRELRLQTLRHERRGQDPHAPQHGHHHAPRVPGEGQIRALRERDRVADSPVYGAERVRVVGGGGAERDDEPEG
ncbi:hypothetical protein LTR53_020459, partial [Teratosphaeriaceae sp. CCFEE 6253]